MQVNWNIFKQSVQNRNMNIQYIELDDSYHLSTYDGSFALQCTIHKKLEEEQVLDFETNFKANGNKPISGLNLPFASKILPNGKKLFKREHGIQTPVTAGSNTILFTIPYPWVKMIGVEILYGEKLDTCDFMVLDSTTGTYTTIPNYQLNQFGFGVNIAEGEYEEECAYDADLYQGMQVKIVYNSVSVKTIGINFNLNEVKS